MSAIFYAANAAPIDRVAARVASQRNCVDCIDVDKDSLINALTRLQRKQRLLKAVLKIDRVTQHKNLKARLKKNILTKGSDNPRAVVEYVQNGEKIFKYQESISSFVKQDMRKKAMPAHRTNAAEYGYFLVEATA